MLSRSARHPALRAGRNPAPTKRNGGDTAVIVALRIPCTLSLASYTLRLVHDDRMRYALMGQAGYRTMWIEGATMVELDSVTKTYTLGQQRIVAVNDVSLTIQSGEFVAIMGKSGCGKTTLLSLIGGLDRPDKGRINVNGQEITQLGDSALTRYRRDKVGIVFQFFNLIPILTVTENVALPHSLQGKSENEIQARVQELLGDVDLSERQTHYPHEISGGEMQRVAIARALINQPQLVLADEPTGNLDSRTGHQVMETMARLSDRHRTTFILATHSSEAAAYASRTLHMRDGSLGSEEAAPEETQP